MTYNLEDGTPSFVIEVDFLKGEKGDKGFSPRIEIASLTSAEYILKIVNEDGEFFTPNLKTDLSLDDYVKKEQGKGLSTNSFENEEKQKLQELRNYDDTDLRNQVSSLVEAIGNINSFEVKVVNELPTENIDLHTFYFVPNNQNEKNIYDEYLYVDNKWEHIGTNEVDLSNYITVNTLAQVKTGLEERITELENDTSSRDIYSTEERVVGVWSDGKPIYRRVFVGTINSSGNYQYLTSTGDIDKIITTKGFIGLDGGTIFEIGGSANYNSETISKSTCRVIVNEKNLRLDYGTDYNGITYKISVEYTKTTDVSGTIPEDTTKLININTNNYSTEEVAIGTWFGEPLYRKCIVGNLTGATTSVPIGVNANVKRWEGFIAYVGGGQTDLLAINYPNPNATIFASINKNATSDCNVGIVDASGGSIGINGYEYVVTVEYTKTTD